MIYDTDIKDLASRWKRASRPLERDDHQYVEHLVEMMGKYNGKVLNRFDEPLEAAIFFIFLELVKDLNKKKIEDA